MRTNVHKINTFQHTSKNSSSRKEEENTEIREENKNFQEWGGYTKKEGSCKRRYN
jgi:hypothetical protein